MAIYKFTKPPVRSIQTRDASKQSSDVKFAQEPQLPNKIIEGSQNIDATKRINQKPQFGFYHIDLAVKNFFDKIKIPTIDGHKELETIVVGGQKDYLYFKQRYIESRDRVKLPILSINRTGWNFNPQKYSIPYFHAVSRFIDRDKFFAKKYFRNWPFIINYSCAIWSSTKEDAELLMAEILPRFDPLASIEIETEEAFGTIQLKLGSCTDSTDTDLGPDEIVKVRYDISIECQGWLALKSIEMPVIRGIVYTKEII